MPSKHLHKRSAWRVVLLLLGLALIFYLLHKVGWSRIGELANLIGWGFGLVLLYAFVWMGANTLAWAVTLRSAKPISFIRLFVARFVGETFNTLIPSGYMAGEALKAKLLSKDVPFHEAASSILVTKVTHSISLVLFLAAGLTLWAPAEMNPVVKKSLLVGLGLLAIGVGIFTWLLFRKAFGRTAALVHRWTGWNWLSTRREQLDRLDESIGNYYGENKGRFMASLLIHILGWILSGFELLVIFALMHQPFDWRQAWFMASMAQLASSTGIILPSGVGLYEGAHYVAAQACGLPPEVGLSAALVRRMREVFWYCIGLLVASQILPSSFLKRVEQS